MQQMTIFASASEGPHISIVAEPIAHIGGLVITNSLITGILGYGLLVAILWHTANVVRHRKKRSLLVQIVTWVYESLYGTVEQIIGNQRLARAIAPLPITMFFFIIVQYWIGILPFIGPITLGGVPLFRGLAADLNTTFALATVTIVAAQVYAVKVHGLFGNAARYLRNPIKDPAGAFEGILELIAELSRLVGLSFRLFGNVFAGEVLLVIIAFLTKYAAVVALPPFYIFELFIGSIQAYIFFMLTTVFISLGLVSHDTDHDVPSSHSSPVMQTAQQGE